MSSIVISRAGPLVTLQDRGRFGMLQHGISASGPMDARSFRAAGALLERAGRTGIEFTQAGLAFRVDGEVEAGVSGGEFGVRVNGKPHGWPARLRLMPGDQVDITPGPRGNYGYLRFNRGIDVAPLLGSRATNLAVGLGGFRGRALKTDDRLDFGGDGEIEVAEAGTMADGPIRIIWGLHAELFDASARAGLVEMAFAVSSGLDRMGVRLTDTAGVFRTQRRLSLVSDAIVAGDIQILGDGTPIVLMRDHQPTGGYPRIGTVVSADLDRFAQLRPGTEVRFRPVTLEHAK